MARPYANENFPFLVVKELRRLGHDVLTVQETGKAGLRMSDPEVLAAAGAERRAVLTLNRRHFIRLHRDSPGHAGIVVCSVDDDFIGQAVRIDAALAATADPGGALLRVNRPPR